MVNERVFFPWIHMPDPDYAHLHPRDPPELKGFFYPLAFGEPVGSAFPVDVVFELDPNGGAFLPDSIPNTTGVYVVSERLRGLLEKSGAHFEFHLVRIRNHKGRIEKAPYFIANLLDVVDCMDRARSDYSPSDMDPTQMRRITPACVGCRQDPRGHSDLQTGER